MIGRDPKLHQIIQTIRTTAPSDASVLIEGESGTGKELIAAAFHAQSHRSADHSSRSIAPRYHTSSSNPSCLDIKKAPLPEQTATNAD